MCMCVRLIAHQTSHAKFHCNRFTAVQDIQEYASLIFGTHCRPTYVQYIHSLLRKL